jgi:citrate synthase
MSHDGLLPTPEAAARLGVKPQTLYAYVSRGLLHRTVAMDGRSSLFDPAELDALKLGRVDRTEGELRTVIATGITRVDDQELLVRGTPLVAHVMHDDHGFTDLVDLLWDAPAGERWPEPNPDLVTDLDGIDGLRTLVATASAADPLRHDLAPSSVRAAGRNMLTAMVYGLEPQGRGKDGDIVAALWRRLTKRPGKAAQRRALDVALALLVDHGIAASTLAARVAASVRADPYSVVSAGLGAIGGPLHGAASAGVHALIAQAAATDDAAGAVGAALRDGGRLPGYGHSVYTVQDPRYGALMEVVVDAWTDDPRLQHVFRVRDVVSERRSDLPNIDLALGAMTWLSGMDARSGETIFAIARTAGWLAHAGEEYGESPLRFRPRARYTGPTG